MELKDLRLIHRNRKKRRLGRGHASGRGKTAARGHKGTGQRAGRKFYIGFEGGNVPFLRKIPKRGFSHKKKVEYQTVNLLEIDKKFAEGERVNPSTLKEKNLIKNDKGAVKILAKGELSKRLKFRVHKSSQQALAKIKESKSEFEILNLNQARNDKESR